MTCPNCGSSNVEIVTRGTIEGGGIIIKEYTCRECGEYDYSVN